jgi:MFS family permease
MTPIAGKLSDIYGKKKVLLVILIVYITGVSIARFSTNTSVTGLLLQICFPNGTYCIL